MKKIILSIVVGMSLFSLAGCSTKNILMPGKDKSDCELLNNGSSGVCGSPYSIYKARDKINGLSQDSGEEYFIHDNGDIQEIKSGELGDVVEVKTDSKGKKYTVKKGTDRRVEVKDKDGNFIEGYGSNVVLGNNSYMLGEESDTVMIRNQEVIREAWINTYADKYGNLAIEHRIMIMTKKAGWAIGEKTPKNVSQKKFIPSRIAKEVLMNSNSKISKQDEQKMNSYVNNVSETPKEDLILKNYLKGK